VAIDADLEIGGTDQLFNLLFGRDIMRGYGKTPQDVAVFPLLEGLDGVQKMSKSLGNYIGITEAPGEVYGKVMSIPDPMTARYAALLLHRDELPPDPRDAKAAVARGLVERLHGAAAAAEAEAEWERRFRRRELPTDVEEISVEPGTNLISLLLRAGFAKSASEAMRLLKQGGVRVDGEKVATDLPLADGALVQVGKRRAARVSLR
jgi:tyrosyl-tRNA synthetase